MIRVSILFLLLFLPGVLWSTAIVSEASFETWEEVRIQEELFNSAQEVSVPSERLSNHEFQFDWESTDDSFWKFIEAKLELRNIVFSNLRSSKISTATTQNPEKNLFSKIDLLLSMGNISRKDNKDRYNGYSSDLNRKHSREEKASSISLPSFPVITNKKLMRYYAIRSDGPPYPDKTLRSLFLPFCPEGEI